MMQAQLFVMDEMSMIGRQMMGKTEFRVKDTLKGTVPRDRVGKYLGGRDAVLAGDPKQAPPICDEPIYRVGEYRAQLVTSLEELSGRHPMRGVRTIW